MTADELLDAIRAAPDDEGPRLVYADWLLSTGDDRGELVHLDERERRGGKLTIPQLDRLLELASIHGFPYLPDDPCRDIPRWTGGGAYPTQYFLTQDGHEYYLRWRYGFSIEVDDETVLECDLQTTTTNEWTFRETTVVLAIVSAAIARGQPLSALAFPDEDGFRTHPHYHVGRSPLYSFPDVYPADRSLEVRDFSRWYRLYERRQKLARVSPLAPQSWIPRCRCNVPGMSCGVGGCELEPR